MIFIVSILFSSVLLGGFLNYLMPGEKSAGSGYRLTLVFAGSYLFSITIVNLIPELYESGLPGLTIGIYILVGFFLQQVLEYFSSGIEHGHIHLKNETHHHTKLSAFTVLIALCIHAFMEGTLFSNPVNSDYQNHALLTGIVLHKIPAAFALMSIVICQVKNKNVAFVFLIIFALASPLGMWLSDITYQNHLIMENTFVILFALVSGSFLHISTTIVFEGSPGHTFNLKKLLAGILGAFIAIGFEYLV